VATNFDRVKAILGARDGQNQPDNSLENVADDVNFEE
jgi:hypothetical protein